MRSWGALGGAAAVAGVIVLWIVAANLPAPSPGAEDPDLDAGGFLATFEPLRFEDPHGDATDTGASGFAAMARCAVGEALMGECIDDPVGMPLGTPGPHYDIVEIAVEGETEDALVASMSIAELSEGFPELWSPAANQRMAWYRICWAPTMEHACDRGPVLFVMNGDHVHTEARFEVQGGDCNEWSWCARGADVEIEFGAPAKITWTIAKAHISLDGAPQSIHSLHGETGWFQEAEAIAGWHGGFTVHTPVYVFHTHPSAPTGLNYADFTAVFDVGIDLVPSSKLPEHPADVPLLVGTPGLGHGARNVYVEPEMDILWFDLHEDDGDLVAVFALNEYEARPAYDFDYSVAVGFDWWVYEIGYRHEGGRYYGYAGRCIMEMCQNGTIMTPRVEEVYGSPGYLLIRTPLEFLGDPAPGTATRLFWAMTMYSDVNLYWGDHANDDFYGDVHNVFMLDSLVGGSPYVFGSGHRAPLAPYAGAGHEH